MKYPIHSSLPSCALGISPTACILTEGEGAKKMNGKIYDEGENLRGIGIEMRGGARRMCSVATITWIMTGRLSF